MGDALEVELEGNVYRCYASATGGGDDGEVDTYVVAGLGRIAINRRSGDVVNLAAISPAAAASLKALAPMIHQRASGKYRI